MNDIDLTLKFLVGARLQLLRYKETVKKTVTDVPEEDIKKSNKLFMLGSQVLKIEEMIKTLEAMNEREDQEEEKEPVCESCRIRPTDRGQGEK